MRRTFCVVLAFSGYLTMISPHLAGAVTGKHTARRRHDVAKRPAPRALDVDTLVRGVPLRILLVQWQRVAICEVDGDWSMTGPRYSGIGFSNATWSQYGGARYAPLAGEATRVQQVLVAMRVTHGWVPDQNGCSRAGW